VIKKLVKGALFAKPISHQTNELRRLQAEEILPTLENSDLGTNAISISGSAHLLGALHYDGIIKDYQYPEHDCRALPVPEDSCDIYLSDQVLEHVGINPLAVFDEAHRVVKPNGLIVVSTCFMNPLHMEPNDYLRFTTHGLELLARESNFELVKSYSVGGLLDIIYRMVGGAGMNYRKLPILLSQYVMSLPTSHKYPVIVGIIAKKPDN